MNRTQISRWGIVALSVMTMATTGMGAAEKRGPGLFQPLPIVSADTEIQNMFQALRDIRAGNYRGAQQELRQAIASVRISLMAPAVRVLLRQALQDSNNSSLTAKERISVVVDQVSTALTLTINEKAKEWKNKTEMRAAIQYLRVAKLVSERGFEGKAESSVIQAKGELLEFSQAPAIQKALDLMRRAQNRLDNGQSGPGVQSLLQEAIETIQNSKVFKKS